MITKDRYEGCHPEIKKALEAGEVIRCYVNNRDDRFSDGHDRWPYKGWVIDYVPFVFHRYIVILDIDVNDVQNFEVAEPIEKEEIKLQR